jgi:hypothetical protein
VTSLASLALMTEASTLWIVDLASRLAVMSGVAQGFATAIESTMSRICCKITAGVVECRSRTDRS